jgi:hypothetical protein
VYWVIHASNTIIKSLPPERAIPTNTTGQITLSSLVALSELIARHIPPVPSTIYRLFQSVIEARKQTHTIFMQIVADDPDPEVEKSNESHKHWIDGLRRAFSALGGDSWLAGRKDTAESASDEEEDEEVIFLNKFAGLNMNDEEEEDENEEDQISRQRSSCPCPVTDEGKERQRQEGEEKSKEEEARPPTRNSSRRCPWIATASSRTRLVLLPISCLPQVPSLRN